MKPKAIIVCVEFEDLLALTLPYLLRHVARLLVVTTPADLPTQRLCGWFPKTSVLTTDVFHARGAEFNKGAALEEGFERLGRRGWILVLDVDIVLPRTLDLAGLDWRKLYGARRRLLADPAALPTIHDPRATDWSACPPIPDAEPGGYFQLFHASHPALVPRPWYPTDFRSAATVDSHFSWKFGAARAWLPQDVLHLGPYGGGWCGRTLARLDDGRVPPEAPRRAAASRRVVEARVTGSNYERLGAPP